MVLLIHLVLAHRARDLETLERLEHFLDVGGLRLLDRLRPEMDVDVRVGGCCASSLLPPGGCTVPSPCVALLSKVLLVSVCSVAAGSPGFHPRASAPSLSAQALAPTRCSCSGRQSLPVAARRCWNAH